MIKKDHCSKQQVGNTHLNGESNGPLAFSEFIFRHAVENGRILAASFSQDQFWRHAERRARFLHLKPVRDPVVIGQDHNLRLWSSKTGKWTLLNVWRPLYYLFFYWQLTVNVQYIMLPMTGFEPGTSGIGSDRSTNWATTTAHFIALQHMWRLKFCNPKQ